MAVFHGHIMNPKGSGWPGNPTIIDQYGSGPKPVIDRNEAAGDAVVYIQPGVLGDQPPGNSRRWHDQN